MSDGLCRLQNAPQIVVAVARTLQFYLSQSDVQLSAQTQQQVVAVAVVMTMLMTTAIIMLHFWLTPLQISSCMKAWSATFGVDSIMQSLSGQDAAAIAAFQAILQ
jgi:hypothetical protein